MTDCTFPRCGCSEREQCRPEKQPVAEIDLTQFEGHTPGPWEIDKNEHGYWQVADKQDAICCNSSCYAGYGKPELDAANARLIAAAPDLLAALKAALARAEAAEKERDEWRQACLGHGEKADRAERQRDEAIAASDARVEAMREASATVCDDKFDKTGIVEVLQAARAIRALPIPAQEGK